MTKFNDTKLVEFAKQVGIDYRELKTLLQQIQQAVNNKATSSEITQAVTALKNELLNGVGSEYDTLKELADKLTELASGSGVGEVLTQKLTEINTKLSDLENVDLLGTYNQAKNGE